MLAPTHIEGSLVDFIGIGTIEHLGLNRVR